jgi:hypothetical protein
MTIDQETIDRIKNLPIETVNEKSPGMPLMLKTTEAVRHAFPGESPGQHKVRAEALVSRGAVALVEGELTVTPAFRQIVAPWLLAKPGARALDPREKRARIDAAVEERKAQDKSLQGGSSRTKARVAMVREEEMNKLGKGNP